MFTLFVIMLWIIIIGTLIGAAMHVVSGIPGFFREARLRYEEEKWRQCKEKEFLKSIEWEKRNPRLYEMRKATNPYRKDFYYLLKPKDRGFFNPEDSLY